MTKEQWEEQAAKEAEKKAAAEREARRDALITQLAASPILRGGEELKTTGEPAKPAEIPIVTMDKLKEIKESIVTSVQGQITDDITDLFKPAIWIGEVLHGSPGPQIADVMPITFILGNVAVIGALSTFAELRTALNLSLLALFINYVGCGLEGTKGLADYNLALDDGVKGCPTYEQVRQPSMETFDPKLYTGRWYEHGFHDWTQFSDVYDTTLDIELSKDGGRWLDDFALRGPAPKAAPISWEKSPVANGAHYFLYGKLNKAEPRVVEESGFGVTFPNYIVDVQKDEAGKYTEAIQFQCLERGGVRIFEGINFLSRSPEMSPASRAAMFERARLAGMAPYGATPEQMHEVPHVRPGTPDFDNSWQGLWRAIKFPELLELLETSTHSAFEDTSIGRDINNLKD